MTNVELLYNVLAGGILGLLGQGVRIAVGLKKLHDSNTAKVAQDNNPESFNPGRLMVSLFVGFVAGAIGMLVKNPTPGGDLTTESIVTIIAIGYSGADFIEGLFNTYIQKFNPPGATPVAAQAPAAVAVVAPASTVVVAADTPAPITHSPASNDRVVAIADTSNSGEHDR